MTRFLVDDDLNGASQRQALGSEMAISGTSSIILCVMMELCAAGLDRVHEPIGGPVRALPEIRPLLVSLVQGCSPVLGASGPGPGGADASTPPRLCHYRRRGCALT